MKAGELGMLLLNRCRRSKSAAARSPPACGWQALTREIVASYVYQREPAARVPGLGDPGAQSLDLGVPGRLHRDGARDASPVVRLRHAFTAEGNHFAAAAQLVDRSEIGSSQGNVL